MKLGIAINFCSNEERFLRPCLERLGEVSSNIIVAVSDHFFDGTKEDMSKIRGYAAEFPGVEFLIYAAKNQYQPRPGIYSRKIAAQKMNEDVDWILFIDVDEIIDVTLFKEYLFLGDYELYDTIRFANYYYFRQPIFQAFQIEDSAVLVRRYLADFDPLLQQADRGQVHEMVEGRKARLVMVDGKCIVHHFSWVRSKKEMLRKVISWGHKHDRDWTSLVEEEFSREFSGKCFVHNYSYRTVSDFYHIGHVHDSEI